MKTRKRKAILYLLITFTLWGSLYVVSKYTLGKLPPFTISFFRFVIATLTLTLMLGRPEKKIERKDYKYILLIGAVGYFGAVGAQLLGTKYAGASVASLINSLNPVTMTLFGVLILGEALNAYKIIGILLALAGVYVIMGHGTGGNGSLGIILSLISVIVWSFVSVMTRKAARKYQPLQITRDSAAVAALCYLPVCIWEISSGQAVRFDWPAAAALVYMGSVCTGAAYFLWNESLSILEAGVCSAFYPIQPLVAAVLGAIFLHEVIGLSFWAGALLIVAGILVNLLLGNRSRHS